MYNGIMNVYKEAGYTSHDVVARLRGICKMKRSGIQEHSTRMRSACFLYVWVRAQNSVIC